MRCVKKQHRIAKIIMAKRRAKMSKYQQQLVDGTAVQCDLQEKAVLAAKMLEDAKAEAAKITQQAEIALAEAHAEHQRILQELWEHQQMEHNHLAQQLHQMKKKHNHASTQLHETLKANCRYREIIKRMEEQVESAHTTTHHPNKIALCVKFN